MPPDPRAPHIAEALAAAGFLAPHDEAHELLAAAADDRALQAMLARRLEGEPLAWITGRTTFAGCEVAVHPGVYVPRPHSELLIDAVLDRLPPAPIVCDACCGSGALGLVVAARRPDARVIGIDVDPRAVACAQANGLEAWEGDLLDPLANELHGKLDVVVASVPYVPTDQLVFLARDSLAYEDVRSYDGGPDGMAVLGRLAHQARGALAPGGRLVVEVGGDQGPTAIAALAALGYGEVSTLVDEDGDLRGIVSRRGSVPAPSA